LNHKVSSNYFAESGVDIFLSVDMQNKITGFKIGNEISISINSFKKGLAVSPLGLFSAHTLQLGPNFDVETGGLIRFGYLKRIFSARTLFAVVKHFTRLIFRKQFSKENLFDYWQRQFRKDWGMYEAMVAKDNYGIWRVFAITNGETQAQPAKELIARFKVNKAGIVTGIEEMYIC
jgi:hypothetical protein